MAPLKHGRVVRRIDAETSLFWDATPAHPGDDAVVDVAVKEVVHTNERLLKELRSKRKKAAATSRS